MFAELTAAETTTLAALRDAALAALRESASAVAAILRDAASSPVPLDRASLSATIDSLGTARKQQIDRYTHAADLARSSFASLRQDAERIAEVLGEPKLVEPPPPAPSAAPVEPIDLSQTDVIEVAAAESTVREEVAPLAEVRRLRRPRPAHRRRRGRGASVRADQGGGRTAGPGCGARARTSGHDDERRQRQDEPQTALRGSGSPPAPVSEAASWPRRIAAGD